MVEILKLQRVIVTGANGSGKSRLAAILALKRPGVPIISYDAIKLKRNWQTRPKAEIEERLLQAIQADSWILEGGPSLLPLALSRADGVIWLDPPEIVRMWRLFIRPLRNIGRNRAELPPGNLDWPFQQYKFAIRSHQNREKFRYAISQQLTASNCPRVWHIRSVRELEPLFEEWVDRRK